MTQNPITALIAKKRADLAKLERQRDVVAVEIRTLEEAARAVEKSIAVEGPVTLTPATGELNISTVPAAIEVGADNPARAGISLEWKPVLARLAAQGDSFDYQAMLRVTAECGLVLTPGSARAKAMGWRQAQLVETIRPGIFRVTKKGLELVKGATKD